MPQTLPDALYSRLPNPARASSPRTRIRFAIFTWRVKQVCAAQQFVPTHPCLQLVQHGSARLRRRGLQDTHLNLVADLLCSLLTSMQSDRWDGSALSSRFSDATVSWTPVGSLISIYPQLLSKLKSPRTQAEGSEMLKIAQGFEQCGNQANGTGKGPIRAARFKRLSFFRSLMVASAHL